MLAYFLALAVGLGSFSIYMAAFFFPEVHRKSDFAWSGVGFFYALILWACAGRITGALLLGQMAAVALLGWFAWETLSLRRQVTPIAEQTPMPQSVNLPGGMGGALTGMFAKKPEPATKKPKFVRAPKPKSDVVPAPVADRQVKAEQPAVVSPLPEIVAESAIAPELLPLPDSTPPATEEIQESIAIPVADTSPAPVESAPTSDTTITPKVSEIATTPTVGTAEAPTDLKQEPEVDDFDQMWRAAARGSESASPTAAPAADSTAVKAPKKSAGFSSLFDNIKNSLGGLLGRGGEKTKPIANNTPVTTAKVPSESIELASEVGEISTPEFDQILASELAEAAQEVAAETSSTVADEIPGVPFPLDVEAMAELISEETAISPVQITEITVVEVVSPTPAAVEVSSEASDNSIKQQVESIASANTPELIHPNPPTPNLLKTDKPADESKSENLSDSEQTTL
ncbi:MAG: Ycf66 family protein [Microcoleus sp.]